MITERFGNNLILWTLVKNLVIQELGVEERGLVRYQETVNQWFIILAGWMWLKGVSIRGGNEQFRGKWSVRVFDGELRFLN